MYTIRCENTCWLNNCVCNRVCLHIALIGHINVLTIVVEEYFPDVSPASHKGSPHRSVS